VFCFSRKTFLRTRPVCVGVNKEPIHKNRVLYDKECLTDLCDRFGNNAVSIKANVKTNAKVYEIRTAMACHFDDGIDDDGMTSRYSRRIESNCEAFQRGEWTLDDSEEITYRSRSDKNASVSVSTRHES
jgi:hypothetical protein